MSGGAWSNDQLNSIVVYDIDGKTVILRVDSSGLYYLNKSNGSYFKVSTDTQFNNDVAVFLSPGMSSVAGVTYIPANIEAGEIIYLAGSQVAGILDLHSPEITGKTRSALTLRSGSNYGVTDDSIINFFAAHVAGSNNNEIGQGTVDEGGGYGFFSTFTSTEIAADYVNNATYGVMVTTRRYLAQWTGTVQSTTSGDRIGLRIYSGPNNNSLTGATLLYDAGQITAPAANAPAPFHVEWELNGLPSSYVLLAARRVSGSGTCSGTIATRKYEDIVPSY